MIHNAFQIQATSSGNQILAGRMPPTQSQHPIDTKSGPIFTGLPSFWSKDTIDRALDIPLKSRARATWANHNFAAIPGEVVVLYTSDGSPCGPAAAGLSGVLFDTPVGVYSNSFSKSCPVALFRRSLEEDVNEFQYLGHYQPDVAPPLAQNEWAIMLPSVSHQNGSGALMTHLCKTE